MKKVMNILLVSLVFSIILLSSTLVLAQEDDSSVSDDDNSGSRLDASVDVTTDDDSVTDNSESSDDSDAEVRTRTETRTRNADGTETRSRVETRVRIRDGETEREVRIRAEGADAERIRTAIATRNRIRISVGSDDEIPENCTKTGVVLKCSIEGSSKIDIETSSENVNLSSEAQQALESLRASLNDTTGDIKIKIKVEKSGNEDSEVESEVEVEGVLTTSQQTILDTLVSQIISVVENAESEAKIEVQIERRFRERREMSVIAGNSGNIIVQIKGENMTTNVTLYHHNGRVFAVVNGSNGEEAREIKVMPDEVRERIRERIKAQIESEGEIELDEEGRYKVEVRKRARFLGLFAVSERVDLEFDSETGEVIRERAPWWTFMSADVEEETSTDAAGTFPEGESPDESDEDLASQ